MNKRIYDTALRLQDIALSGIAIVLTFPLLITSLLLSSIFIGFPPLYSSIRIGLEGKPYKHIKIRTMYKGSERGRFYFELDRIGSLGKLLRKYHIDEIPELFLIFTGKMSFVGPRPLMPINLPQERGLTRENVLPGWTCLAQISLARNGRLDRYKQLKLDDLYVKKRSVIYYWKILFATLSSVFRPTQMDISPVSTENRKRFLKSRISDPEYAQFRNVINEGSVKSMKKNQKN